tara:strand:- start:14 stop:745 length:732 start_codon:yes stop_codon:yes gene_type:complete
MADLVTSQKLIDTETKTVYKFTNVSDGSGETNVKKIDLSELNWAWYNIVLDVTAGNTGFKIGEEIRTDMTEYYVVTDYKPSGTEVQVIGWDHTNKVATTALTTPTVGDSLYGTASGAHLDIVGSGPAVSPSYSVIINKIQWVCNGMSVNVEWDGSTTETLIAGLSGNGLYNGNNLEFPAIPIDAVGNTGGVLGNIQFTTAGAASGDTYTVWIELSKMTGFDTPLYEENHQLGYPVDYVLGNRP